MKTKSIIINLIVSIIIGIIFGFISEYALILNIDWLIKITQSFEFWGIIILISAIMKNNYCFALLNPIIIMSFMNITYYIIRLMKSGYTNIFSWKMYTLTGIAGSLYLGTIIFIIKNLIINHKNTNYEESNLIFMTICGLGFTIYGFNNPIGHNLFFNIDIGIIFGFLISTIIVKLLQKNKS